MYLPALAPTPQAAEVDLVSGHVEKARQLVRKGRLMIWVGIVPAVGWMAFAPLASSVLASGFVKVDLNRSVVAHMEGGTVRTVHVRDGQQVKAGQPLIELGDVSVSAERTRLAQRLMSERAGLARLEAEQARRSSLTFPPDLVTASASDPNLRAQMDKELSLFTARRQAIDSQIGLLREQKLKIEQEIEALQQQIANTQDSIKSQSRELELNSQLAKDGFVSATQVMQLEASVADYRGKISERNAELARARQRTGDIELKVSQLQNDYRQQASDQLKVANVRAQEIEQELLKASDASRRQVVTAPVDGEVIGLRYTSSGSVIPPREAVAEIVPSNPKLIVEARIRTEDISRVHRDQLADLRFTAFKYRTTHMVHGKVSYVGADRQVERETGMAYYTVNIDVAQSDVEKAVKGEHARLHAGMPAEVYLHGEVRTPLQYLLEPITQVLRRAARER
ncbi:MAG TPA: HlyD family type I secretion periplasmic adaptor subunit [Burkholderiaceae bacterium]|nr:HlyD family type I secretion periplasmic adaptor subunit [Burkholderiaceae bacterium]